MMSDDLETKSALNPPVVCSADHGVGLALCCFLVYSIYEVICFMSYLVLFCSCVFCCCCCFFFFFVFCFLFFVLFFFFNPFSIAITSLGEERANFSAFRAFFRLALVWFCLFLHPLGVWEGLRFVIVALPGLISYLFYFFIYLLFFLFIYFF